ncbi:hypothetical protein Taro_025504 [Colocasia esculenta]|uniref:Symplekin/Pta1 N-terminal domain-containing protein n=1 Tax=Colocasia esculenta TaxID=4460 RepID=A0A843V9J7_COLES|nr:hypothetical protein [Colocasia esculenta]
MVDMSKEEGGQEVDVMSKEKEKGGEEQEELSKIKEESREESKKDVGQDIDTIMQTLDALVENIVPPTATAKMPPVGEKKRKVVKAISPSSLTRRVKEARRTRSHLPSVKSVEITADENNFPQRRFGLLTTSSIPPESMGLGERRERSVSSQRTCEYALGGDFVLCLAWLQPAVRRWAHLRQRPRFYYRGFGGLKGMVGLMAVRWGERAAGLLDAVKKSAPVASKMENLRQLKEVILRRDIFLLPEYALQLAELQGGQPSPVRKFIAEAISEIGMKNMDLLPEIVPTLIYLLRDETPAVTRQAITSGTSLFRSVLEKLGLHSSELDQSLDLSWKAMLKFKDAVFPIAFQPGSDGVRLLAIKFIEAMILLYTPDPNISSEPPNEMGDGFSISWVRGCHPVLNVGDLATESSQSLGMLLDQLRFPQVKSLSNSIVIVLVNWLCSDMVPENLGLYLNCLSAIAKKRPSFYGRVLPVLLTLDPLTAVVKGVEVSAAYHALKSSFLAFLQCTHPAAAPWRPRVVEALKAMNVAMPAEPSLHVDKIFGTAVISTTMEETLPIKKASVGLDGDGVLYDLRLLDVPPAHGEEKKSTYQRRRDPSSGPQAQDAGYELRFLTSFHHTILRIVFTICDDGMLPELSCDFSASGTPLPPCASFPFSFTSSLLQACRACSQFPVNREKGPNPNAAEAAAPNKYVQFSNMISFLRLHWQLLRFRDDVAEDFGPTAGPAPATAWPCRHGDANDNFVLLGLRGLAGLTLSLVTTVPPSMVTPLTAALYSKTKMRVYQTTHCSITTCTMRPSWFLPYMALRRWMPMTRMLGMEVREKAVMAQSRMPRRVRLTQARTPGRIRSLEVASEDDLLLERRDELQSDLARKRGIKEEVGDLMQDDITPGKRARISPVISQETAKESSQLSTDHIHDSTPLIGTKASTGSVDNGPVQQLVGMFGALVAQGDKAVESLDILISSISSDLLAEVVMVNLQHLPHSCPKSEGEEEQYGVDYMPTLVGKNQSFIRPSFMSDILSLSSALALINTQSAATNDTSKLPVRDEVKLDDMVDTTSVSPLIPGDTKKIGPGDSIDSVVPAAVEAGTTSNAPLYMCHNLGTLESEIPGLESVAASEIQEPADVSQSSTSELQGSSQEQVVSSGSKMQFDTTTSGLMSTFSETLSSSATLMDSGLSALTTSASVTVTSQYFLPKMMAPVIDLTDEQRDHLQKAVFLHIIEAYKQIVVAGASQTRFSLLACLGVEV